MEKDNLRQALQQLKPVIGKKADGLWKMYMLADTPEEKAEIIQIVKLQADKLLDTLSPEQINLIPPKVSSPGRCKIGTILYGRNYTPVGDFSIDDNDFIRHVGIFGSTGSGKTTAVYNILKQLTDSDKPFMVLDWKKDYRDLLKLPEFKDKVLVFTVGRNVSPFHFNPLQKPPGVDDHVWKKHLLEIVCHAYLLGPGAESVIMEHIDDNTFADMLDNISKKKKFGREDLWKSSAKRTLEAINYKGIYEVVNSESFDIPDLLNKQVILELEGLSESDKVFLIGSLLQWIYYYRMNQPEREVWKHTIFLEEAHHLLLKQPASKPESQFDVLMREVRVFGQGMIIIDQEPSKLSDSAMANINTKITMNLNHGADVPAMSKALLLKREETAYLGMLGVGYAIIKTGRITLPFLCRLPDFKIRKGVMSDRDVSEHMERYPQYSVEIKPHNQNQRNIRSIPKDESPLSPIGKVFLQNIAENQFMPISKRYKMLGLNAAQGTDVQNELIGKGFVIPATVDAKKLLDLTQKARV